MRDALARRRELGGGDEVHVQTTVAVVVEERHPAAARLQDVILRGSAAVGARGQTRSLPRTVPERAPRGSRGRRREAGRARGPWRRRGRRTRALSPWSGCSCLAGSAPARSGLRAGRAPARAGPGRGPCRSASRRGARHAGRERRVAARPAAPGRARWPRYRRRRHAGRARRPGLPAAARPRIVHAEPRLSEPRPARLPPAASPPPAGARASGGARCLPRGRRASSTPPP